MTILTVRHVTTYRYRRPVALGDHRMMFRPRDSYDQRLCISMVQSAKNRMRNNVSEPPLGCQVILEGADCGSPC
jgi:hypothetical protein